MIIASCLALSEVGEVLKGLQKFSEAFFSAHKAATKRRKTVKEAANLLSAASTFSGLSM